MLASTDLKIFNFTDSSKRYLAGHGVPDIAAMFGSIWIIASNSKESNYAAVVLFIRFTHFPSIFYPLRFYLREYTLMNKKRERQILRVFYAFLLLIFFAHIFACFLVVLGEDLGNYENDYMWIPINAGLWGETADDEPVTSVSEPGKVYVFA